MRKHLVAHRQVSLPSNAVPVNSSFISDDVLEVLFKYCYTQTFIYAYENSLYAKMNGVEGMFSYYKVEVPSKIEA